MRWLRPLVRPGLGWWMVGLAGCATIDPVSPPPVISETLKVDVAKTHPEVFEEVELLEWQARQASLQGDADSAERYARWARLLVRMSRQAKTATVACVPAQAPLLPSKPEVSVSKAPEKRRRRRKRVKKEAPVEKPTLESLMQARAEKLKRLDAVKLDPDGRVWLDAAQRALIEAQRAVSAGATERARQQLLRVDNAIQAIETEPSGLVKSSTVSVMTPLETLAKDLSTVSPFQQEGWLVVELPHSPEPAGRVSRLQQDSLQALGRLMRVYGGASMCVGAEKKRQDSVQAVLHYLKRVEQLSERRFVPCHPRLRSRAPLFVGLTFSPRKI